MSYEVNYRQVVRNGLRDRIGTDKIKEQLRDYLEDLSTLRLNYIATRGEQTQVDALIRVAAKQVLMTRGKL